MKKLLSEWIRIAKKNMSITVRIDPNHPMVILTKALDWNLMIKIAEKHRNGKIKNEAGRKPQLRILVGAVIVRVLESCTLRKASDYIQHYGPARYICNLRFWSWTPNFRTLCDFEILLGAEGLEEINDYVLGVAKELGFIDIKGLCSDTTAQEAHIPYPNEVGLMGSLARSIGCGISLLGRKLGDGKTKLLDNITRIKKLVRRHRLFCKTLEAKRQVERELLKISNQLKKNTEKAVTAMSSFSLKSLRGHQKTAFTRLKRLTEVFGNLSPQIAYYIKNGKPVSNKIISLFSTTVRSIVRGKAGKKVEFGLKWGFNQIAGGYISIFQLDGKNGEADYAVAAVVRHIEMFGKAPKDYGYDRGGWSKDHIKIIEDLGVKNIAIAPKGKAKWIVSDGCRERLSRERAQVEGKIGTLKGYEFNKPKGDMQRSARRSEMRFNLTKLTKDLKLRKENMVGEIAS